MPFRSTPHIHQSLSALFFSALLFISPHAHAHGGLGHIQVTAWAAENLPPGELRSFLANADTFNALLFGSAYPDIGYYPGLGHPDIARQFAEFSHWPPFMEQFIQWIRINDPPPWNTPESKNRVAFLLGCAAHGFQDEVFDTLFLPQVRHHDNQGQGQADPASDGLLVRDALITDIPTESIPTTVLTEIYNASGEFQEEITEEIINDSVVVMTNLYIEEESGPLLASIAWEQLSDKMSWMSGHYMDGDIPGSLRAEILPTARYLEAIWKRLHGTLSAEDMVIATFPDTPRRLRSHLQEVPDSWVSMMFAAGVDIDTLNVEWTDANDAGVAIEKRGHAWGGSWNRIIRLMPTENLQPGGHYTATLQGETQTVDQRAWIIDHSMSFQVACEQDNQADCPPLENIREARIDGSADFKAEWTAGEEKTDVTNDEAGCAGCSGVYVQSPLLLIVALTALRRRRRDYG